VSLVWTALAAVVLGLLTNELFDLAPWFARRLLRRAARLEKVDLEEARLVFEYMAANLEEVPGKLGKLFWATGRLTNALRYPWQRSRQRRHEKAQPPPVGAVTVEKGAAALAVSVARERRPVFVPMVVVAGSGQGGQAVMVLILITCVLATITFWVWRGVWRAWRSERA
jgi:hypothetical protein